MKIRPEDALEYHSKPPAGKLAVIPTKPCVCPQVLHGSMRLMGGPAVGATVRGVKPSRQCS